MQGKVTNLQSEFNEDTPKIQKVTALDKLSASIRYSDILDGIDLEYVAVSNDVKENIIVKSKSDSYNYTFTLKLNNLKAALLNNEIYISDEKTDEIIYVIPAPYMVDAADEFSTAVTYALVQSGNKEYKLTVTADPMWINDESRVFPVTVDPSVNASHAHMTTTNIVAMMPNANMGGYAFLNIADTVYGYWRAEELPIIPDSAYITNAVIAMNLENTMFDPVGAYPVVSAWDSTLTWNKMLDGQGTFSDYIDYGTVTSGSLCEWNITSLVKDWYSDDAMNYGICFKNISGSNMSKFTSERSTNPSLRPRLILTYRDMKGLESYWSYTSQSAGFAGNGYVNNATGNLVFTIPTLTTTDFLMPFTPTLSYNSDLNSRYATYVNAETAYMYQSAGYGFKWNMCESLLQKQYYNENGVLLTYYVWSDSDGTEHSFMPTNKADIYVDEDGLQLTLIENDDTFTMVDNSNNMRIFEKKTYASYFATGAILKYIADKNGNLIEFTYNNLGRVTGIGLWPSGESKIDFLTLSYNSSGLVNRLYNDATKESVIFYYSSEPATSTLISTNGSGYLRKIVRAHHTGDNAESDWTAFMTNGSHANIVKDATASYIYNGNGRLLVARDELSGYEIQYSYNAAKKIATIQESASEIGQRLGITYGLSYTEIRNSGTDDAYGTSDDLVTRYTFDAFGRVKGSYSTDILKSTIYGASSVEYSDNEKAVNSIKTSSYLGGTSANYLLNGGFEQMKFTTALSYWNTTTNVSKVKDETNANNHVAQFAVKSNTADSLYQYVFLPAGEYTLSMLYSTYNCGNVSASIRADSLSRSESTTESLPVNEHYVDGIKSSISMRITAGNVVNGGERFKISVNVTGGSNVDSAAIVDVDNLLLERNIAPTQFSLVQLGGFDSPTINLSGTTLYTPSNFWFDSGSTNTGIVSAEAPFGNVMSISGYVHTTYPSYVIQSVYTAPSNEIAEYEAAKYYPPMSYQVSGFGKGTRQLLNPASKFEITVTVKYYRGANQDDFCKDYHFAFEPGSTDWQYVSGAFTTDGGNGKLIHEITVACEYTNHPGTAYFDNISVYPCDTDAVQETDYNEDGRYSWVKKGSYIEYYKYDEGCDDEYVADNEKSPKIYTTINNRGDYIEYHYNLEDPDTHESHITNNVQQVKRYRYTGNLAYKSEINLEQLTKVLQSTTIYEYDQFGHITRQTIRIENGTLNASLMSSSATYETTSGSRIFGALTSETDTELKCTKYFYDTDKGYLLHVIGNDNYGLQYDYDSVGNLTKVTPAFYDETSNIILGNLPEDEKVVYNYNAKNQLSSISTNSTIYTLNYDVFGNTDKIMIGNRVLADYEYQAKNGKLKNMTYGNGCIVYYFYDKLENLSEVWYSYDEGVTATAAYRYTYSNNRQLCKFENLLTGKSIAYTYDSFGRLIGFAEYDTDTMTNTFSVQKVYDDQSQIMGLTYFVPYAYSGGITESSVYRTYFYDSESRLSKSQISVNSKKILESSYSYDSMQRVTIQSNNYSSGNSTFNSLYSFGYYDGGVVATNQIISFNSTFNQNVSTYGYEYNSIGNISRITLNGFTNKLYNYDNLGQLIREDNSDTVKTYFYEYDDSGNIVKKRVYNYAAGMVPSDTPIVYNYTYGDAAWGDLLTAYCGHQITYDNIGNPLSYYNGESYTFTWEQGRQLATASRGGKTMSFAYNDNGIRMSKSVNGVEHVYNLDGTRIVSEAWGNHLLIYLYDDTGMPIGMQYRDNNYAKNMFNTYWFEQNLQGDIVAIYDDAGIKLAGYTYDAWGNFTVTYYNGGANSAAQYNPFTYRSYYFDNDLGLYYLNSRYYDSNIGRFINADGQLNDDILGHNLFAYCYNNPVLYKDIDGQGIIFFTVAVLASIIVAPLIMSIGSCFSGAGENSIDEALFDSSKDPYNYYNPHQDKIFWVSGGISEKHANAKISVGVYEGANVKNGSKLGWGVGKASAGIGMAMTDGLGVSAEVSGLYVYGEKTITIFGKQIVLGAEAKLASWGASVSIGRRTGFSLSFFGGVGVYIEFK